MKRKQAWESENLKIGLTKRAPDDWDSARFWSWIWAMAGFRFASWFSPAAGNASR